MFAWFSFTTLNKTSLLSSNIFFSEPASNLIKTNRGRVCVEKKPRPNLVYSIHSFFLKTSKFGP